MEFLGYLKKKVLKQSREPRWARDPKPNATIFEAGESAFAELLLVLGFPETKKCQSGISVD